VVDDTQDAAEALAMILELEGYEVAVAFGGLQAILMFESFRPHIAILDIGMPGVDGYSVAHRIRQTHWGAAIHLIALTGWNDARSRARALTAGFHQYLVKPVDPRRFIRILAAIECIE
jgi:DNA-binding response OmpR family regulator